MKNSQIEFAQRKAALSLTCRVSTIVPAPPEIVWDLLTDARRYPYWNSTISSIAGTIREGERLCIKVPGTSRTFKPRVSGVVVNKRMTWSAGLSLLFRGSRNFHLVLLSDRQTKFIMEERFSGLLFALIRGKLPDFQPIFEAYAQDLSEEASRLATGQPKNVITPAPYHLKP